jgi:hypothetical protein
MTFFLVCSCYQAGLVGILGLTFGLLLETTLLIIRTNRPQPLHERFPTLFDKKIWGPVGTRPPGAHTEGPAGIRPPGAHTEASSGEEPVAGRAKAQKKKTVAKTTGKDNQFKQD